jgi:UDP-N-acetylmuramate dehydrogenase
LSSFLKTRPPHEAVLFVGLGSNLLVRDGGFRGTAILMHQARLAPELRHGMVYAQAGVASPKVARFAALNHLSGAEFMAGIPGTVGGALAMNAGCYGGETWDIVARAVTIDRAGLVHERAPSEYEIAYRHCQSPKEEWFLGAYFRLRPGDGDASRARIKEFLARRIATQPLQLPNAGSVFRNPPGDHAARLIESCGIKGLQRGGARVSEKHANFIVNPEGAASAADIEGLILEVQKIVREKTGVLLVPEVRIVGDPA